MRIKDRFTSQFEPGNEVASCAYAVHEVFGNLVIWEGAPIDVFSVARKCNIDVQFVDRDDIDGSIVWGDGGSALMSISTRTNPMRQRFTVAHELGHWLLRKVTAASGSEAQFRGMSHTRCDVAEEEYLANLLAAEILMPSGAVFKACNRSKISLSLVASLSRQFDVSRIALMRRVADVVQQSIVFVNVVPTVFRDLNSVAEIDDAIYFSPRQSTLRARERTRFVEQRSYSELLGKPSVYLELNGPNGAVRSRFDVQDWKRPIPNCDLLAVGRFDCASV